MDAKRQLWRSRTRWAWGMLACLLCALLVPFPAAAEQPIRVKSSDHAITFGQEVRFHLEVEGQDPIQSIVLAYRASDLQGTIVQTMTFSPATSVSVDHVHQIERHYIRPFATVTYWWTISTVSQAQLTTEPQAFSYDDNRFDWQSLSADPINLHWYRGDVQVAQKSLDLAVAGLDRARQDISVDAIRQPFDIYLYSSEADMRAALPASLPAEGKALTLYEASVILVALGPEEDHILDLKSILPHEVTHALIHEATQGQFDHVPLWLAEGLATSVQYTFEPDPDAQLRLEQALSEGEVLSLDTLCGDFPRDPTAARLAYAESASVVNYIRDIHGRPALRDLVAAYGDGATCRGGVQRVLGVSLDRLLAQWSASVAPKAGWTRFWQDNGAWLVLLCLFSLLPLSFVLPLRVRRPAVRNAGRAYKPAADHPMSEPTRLALRDKRP